MEECDSVPCHSPQRDHHHQTTAKVRVFTVIESAGDLGATCDEIETILKQPHQTISARVYDLVKEDRIANSGQCRTTRSGKNAIVYRVGIVVAVSSPVLLSDAWVYFMECVGTGFIKIGYTTALSTRLKDLQTASPFELKLLGAFPGTEATEKAIHTRFGTYMFGGNGFGRVRNYWRRLGLIVVDRTPKKSIIIEDCCSVDRQPQVVAH